MEFDLVARSRLRAVTHRFATCADRNEAIKALHLLSSTFKYGIEGDLKPKGALANVLMMRQIAEYQTRHHVFEPHINEATRSLISGIVPVNSTKLEDGKMTISVNEFHVTIILQGDDWLIDRLNMVPFASSTNGFA